MSKMKVSKAEGLLKSNKSVAERAGKYTERIAKTLELDLIERKKEEIEDFFELKLNL